MNVNPWACPKSREIRRVLVSLEERIAELEAELANRPPLLPRK